MLDDAKKVCSLNLKAQMKTKEGYLWKMKSALLLVKYCEKLDL